MRLEAARINTLVTVKKMMLKWWIKLLKMIEQRTPRKLFLRLVTLDGNRRLPQERNWASQVRLILTEAGYPQLWAKRNVEEIEESMEGIIRNLAVESLTGDRTYATTSESSYYKHWTTPQPPWTPRTHKMTASLTLPLK